MSQNNNTAYDFSMFEPAPKKKPQENIIEIPKEKLEQNRRKKVSPLRMISTFFLTGIAVAVVASMIHSQVQLTEINDQLDTQTKKLSESQSLYTQYQMKADAQLTIKKVEADATGSLGMKKVEAYQIEYVTMAVGDKGQVLKKSSGKNWWDSFLDSVSNLVS